MTSSLKRATLSANLFVILWFAIPVAVAAVAFLRLGVLAGAVATTVSLGFCLLLIWRLTKRSAAYVFKRKTVLWRFDRVVERSLWGSGSLKGWTRSNPNTSLADLREGEAPLTNDAPSVSNTPIVVAATETQKVRPLAPRLNRTSSANLVAAAPEPRTAPASTITKLPIEISDTPESAVEYVVKRGDTYWSLAERLWGDGSRWNVIQNLNIGRTVSSDVVLVEGISLVPGWNILLPHEL